MAQSESFIPDNHKESTEQPHGKNRIRASVACNSCRTRRSKCTIKPDNSECEQCRRSKLTCVFDGNDRRKRRRHRNDVTQLSERLAAVESLLKENRRTDDGRSDISELESQRNALHSISSISDQISSYVAASTDGSTLACPPARPQSPPQSEPATLSPSQIPDDVEQMLLDLFWTKYNPIFHFVCQRDFDEARCTKQTNHYSKALHFCILAIGLRYTDKMDSATISLLGDQPNGPSRLHQQAKICVEEELESSVQLPKAQALLLLGDLECGIGHYSGGRMYAGMACRLAVSLIGNPELPEACSSPPYPTVIQTLLYACVVFERYWDLILSGPSLVRGSDVKMLQFAAKFSIMRVELQLLVTNDDESDLSTSLLELATDTGKTSELAKLHRQNMPKDVFQMVALEQELSSWYNDLPDAVRWNALNAKFAGSAFFLFHQHYHACAILLHRPFADFRRRSFLDGNMVDGLKDTPTQEPSVSRLCQMSRAKCIEHGRRLAKIIVHHHFHFNGRSFTFMTVNHADIAATTLLMDLYSSKDRQRSLIAISRLKDLLAVTQALSVTYPPASRLSRAIETELEVWRQSKAAPADSISTQSKNSGIGSCETLISSDLCSTGDVPVPSVNINHPSGVADINFEHLDENSTLCDPSGVDDAIMEDFGEDFDKDFGQDFYKQIASDLEMGSPSRLFPQLAVGVDQSSTGPVHSQWDQLNVWDDIFKEGVNTTHVFGYNST